MLARPVLSLLTVSLSSPTVAPEMGSLVSQFRTSRFTFMPIAFTSNFVVLVPKLFETKPVQGIETDKTAVAKSIFADAPVVVEEKKEKVVKKKVVENVNAFVTFKKIEVVYL